MTRIVFLLLLVVLVHGAVPLHAQEPVVRTGVAGSGGHTASDGTHSLQGTLGQGIVGFSSGTGLVARAGFWQQVRPAARLVAPSAPELLAPVDRAVDLPAAVTLEWRRAADASSYDVQVATSEDFSSMVQDTAGVTTNNLVIEGLSGAITHFWRVRAANGAGASTFAGPFRFTTAASVAVNGEAVPDQFALAANYPNPFYPSTTIVFELPVPSPVRLDVYDVYGRAVATLAEGTRPAGRHEVLFDARQLASGLYFYRIEAGDFKAVHAMILAK